MYFVNNIVNNFSVRNETREGKPFMVIPIVALLEGVHKGSQGPNFYPSSEIEMSAEFWNGVPLTINHPNKRGVDVSAKSKEIEKLFSVGSFENVSFDGGKLKGEGWIDVERLIDLSAETMVRLQQGEGLEVSTGLFSKSDGKKGVWNGEEYEGSVYAFKPDHLAILPNAKGACSMEDGCGIRNNKKCESCIVNKTPKLKEKMLNFLNGRKEGGETINKEELNNLRKQGFYINELSHGKVRDGLRELLNSMDSEGEMNFLREIYNDRFIFEKSNFESGKTQLFSQKYSMNNKTDELKMKGDPIEVREKLEFLPLDEKMIKNSSKEILMARTEQIASLIANKHLGEAFNQDFLTNLEDEQFEKFVALGEKLDNCKECNGDESFIALEEENQTLKEENVALKEELTTNKEKPADKPTFDQILANATPEDKEQWESGRRMYKAEKSKAVESLVANERNPFSKETLEAKSLSDLRDLIKLGNVPVDFSGNAPANEEFNVNERKSDGSGVPPVVGFADSVLNKK